MKVRIGLAAVLAAVLVGAASAARPPAFQGKGTIVLSCAGCPQSPSRAELYTVSASGKRFRRLPTGVHSPYSPRWSRNGRWLAFSSAASIWKLRVRPPAKVQRLTRHCALCDRDPAWSPDGRSLVFVRDGSLYTVRAVPGSRPRLLKRRSKVTFESPDWAPNGRLIAFHDSAEGLYVIRRDRRGLRRIGGAAVRGRLPRWSPDGRTIAFIGQAGAFPVVMVVRPDGTGLRVLAKPTSLVSGVNPAWSPDGRHVLFVVAHEFEPGQSGRELLVAPLEGGGIRRLVIPLLPRTVFADFFGIDWKR